MDDRTVSGDIAGWHLAVGLLALFVLYELVPGLPHFVSPTGVMQLLASDIVTLAAAVLLGWVSAQVHAALARRRGRARTAPRRDTLVAACVFFGLVMFAGLVWERRDAARTSQAGQSALPAAVQPRMTEDAYPSRRDPTPAQNTATAPGMDSAAAKPVVIGVVTPWVEIARRPQYLQASAAERKAIRDLYWLTCVEGQIPPAQRTSTYELFVRDWTIREAAGSEASARTRSEYPSLREPKAVVPSPVNAETMRRWCGR